MFKKINTIESVQIHTYVHRFNIEHIPNKNMNLVNASNKHCGGKMELPEKYASNEKSIILV